MKIVTDQSGRKGEPVVPKLNFIDMAVIKGLSVNREENRPESGYHKFVDIDDMGIAVYTPNEITDPNAFIDPEKNKKMFDNVGQVTAVMHKIT